MSPSTVQVRAADGVPIAFDLYEAPGRREALVVCPGFFQSKETPTFRRMAAVLAEACDILCMDFRGHGRSGGRFAFSAREPADLHAVLDWAAPRYARLGVMGFSLGAATAIAAASQRESLSTLIAVSAPSAFEDIELRFWTLDAIRTGLRGLEPGAGCRPGSLWVKKIRPLDALQQLSGLPILFIHGTRDQTVLPRHSERLYQAARDPKRLLLIEGGGHAQELFQRHAEAFLPPIRAWLQETLQVR